MVGKGATGVLGIALHQKGFLSPQYPYCQFIHAATFLFMSWPVLPTTSKSRCVPMLAGHEEVYQIFPGSIIALDTTI